jgi:ribonuclease P protein component
MQVLFSIPKKTFKRAVKRNIIRRRTKEAFRFNKHALYQNIPENHKLTLAFIYTDNKILNFENIQKEIINSIERIIKRIKQ